jgi:cellulose synthase/poly-beta-1,6-N-acetylglucosamine synthase-like glycosyltransferase
MTALKISVVIPTLNRPDDLRRCLAALKAQGRPADEVVVVIGPGDSLAQPIFEEISNSDARWKYINEQRSSVICSLNTGIRASQGDIITLTDDDAAAPPNWLKLIEAHFLSDSKVGAVGGRDRLMYPDNPELSNPPPASRVGCFNLYGALVGNHHCGAKQSPCEVDVLKGVNLSFRRKAFLKGQISGQLIGYGAEVGWELDICLTIRKANWKIIYDNAVYVDHYAGNRLEGNKRQDGASASSLHDAQNMAYLHTVYLPIFSIFILFVRTTLIGSRFQPGLIRCWLDVLSGKLGQVKIAFKVLVAYWIGTRLGLSRKLSSHRKSIKSTSDY